MQYGSRRRQRLAAPVFFWTWDDVMTDPLIVLGGLDLEARREFIGNASGVIDKAAGNTVDPVGLDCSNIESLDDGTLGMLVLIARQAQRRGVKVTLVEAKPRVRGELDTAGVSHFFNWQP
jgi:anti-anti-sigma factor